MSTSSANAAEDVHGLAERLTKACRAAGLEAEQRGPTRVHVHAPNTSGHLAEVVTIKPDNTERLRWWWSWGTPICAADEIDKAVAMITKVISVPLDARW